MDGNFFDVQRIIKNVKKSDSFTTHYKKHFKPTLYCTDLHKCVALKVINQINPIGSMESFTK